MKLAGIVVAAGRGERFGAPKANIELDSVPLWRRAADALAQGGAVEVVVVGDVPGGVPGGLRRRDSVAAGVAALDASFDHVLVHDAARPLASAALARMVADRLRDGAVAVVPVVPVRDTVKRVDGESVLETVDRTDLVVTQTPQGFSLEVLRAAHDASDRDASDDALLVEWAGFTVVTVPGEPGNLKITYPEDLAVAHSLLT